MFTGQPVTGHLSCVDCFVSFFMLIAISFQCAHIHGVQYVPDCRNGVSYFFSHHFTLSPRCVAYDPGSTSRVRTLSDMFRLQRTGYILECRSD